MVDHELKNLYIKARLILAWSKATNSDKNLEKVLKHMRTAVHDENACRNAVEIVKKNYALHWIKDTVFEALKNKMNLDEFITEINKNYLYKYDSEVQNFIKDFINVFTARTFYKNLSPTGEQFYESHR